MSKVDDSGLIAGSRSGRRRWLIVLLLLLFMIVNFADRAIVGLAAVPIMTDLRLSPAEYGLVASSFFFLFAISAVIISFVANRVETRWLLAVMVVVWSLAQFPMLGNVGLWTLVGCRIVLGTGEGPSLSIALHGVYKWFENDRRTLPTAIILQGGALGVVLALPALNYVIVNYSWRWAFGALGIVGLLWVALWLAVAEEGPLAEGSPGEGHGGQVSYRQLLFSGSFLACSAAGFSASWALALGLSWFTPYLIHGLGFSQSAAGWISAIPWAVGVTVILGYGWLAQVLLHRGATSRSARGLLGGGAVTLGGLLMLCTPFAEASTVKITLLVLGGAIPGVIFVVCPVVIAEFTPDSQRPVMLGVYIALMSLAGIVAPYVVGRIVETAAVVLDGYHLGFLVCGWVLLFGGAIALLLLRPEADAARIARLPTAATVTPA
jgi:MFS transporter, ACS family, D-galactonate transporter